LVGLEEVLDAGDEDADVEVQLQFSKNLAELDEDVGLVLLED